MLSKVLAAVGLAIVVAIGAYFYTQSSSDSDAPPTASILRSHIPADTVSFMLSEKAVPLELMVNTDPSLERLAQMAENAIAQEQTPAVLFWAHLGSAYLRAIQSGTEHLKSEWGFADELSSAAYFVGLSPVIEFSMADSGKLREQVNTAASAAGLTMESAAEGSATVHRVTIFEEDGRQVNLLLRETDGWARLALELPGGESSALVSGAQLPEQSLANTDVLKRAREQFDLRGDAVAVTNFVALAATLTDPQSVSGNMLSKMIPEWDLSNWRSPACQREMAQITAAVPEWLMVGDIEYDRQAQPRRVTSQAQSLLSIRSEAITSSLTKLNGVLPNFTDVDGFDPLYSVGLGLNVSQLAPVLMELYQAALAQTYECEYLKTAQSAIREANPAMLGMATAMVSGVKGMSFTLNDLQIADNLQEVESASALLSLSTESVRELLLLAQGFMPSLAQMDIPEDGSAVPLQIPLLPPQVPPLLIAVKDDHHAVIMTKDDLAQRLAATFSGRGLEGDGFINMSMDAGKLVGLMDKPMQQGLAGMTGVDAATCADIAFMQSTYQNMDLAVSGEVKFDSAGLWAGATLSQALPDRDGAKVQAGAYDIFVMGQGCELEAHGATTVTGDGQGQMSMLSPEPDCDAASYEAKIQWQQRGLGLYYTINEERERASCDEQWGEWSEASGDGRDKSCVITTMDSSSFTCVFIDEQDGSSAYVFKRQ